MVSSRTCLSLLCSWYLSVNGFTSPLHSAQRALDRRIARWQPPGMAWFDKESSTSSGPRTRGTAGTSLSASSPRSREEGFGGGMGKVKSSSSSSKSKKQGLSSSSAAATSSKKQTAPFDVSASVMRHEKRYDQILLRAAKRMARYDENPEYEENDDYESHERTFEFVVASRDGDELPDWVPVAQLIVAVDPGAFQGRGSYNNNDDGEEARLARAAVSAHCREIHHVAGLSSSAFRSIPRQRLRYAVEPADSFYRHVYDKVVELPPSSPMSTVEARKVLQIEEGGTLHDLKLQYRRRSMECHPDRVRHQESSSSVNEGVAPDAENQQSAVATDPNEEFSRVKLAYETLLGSGSMRKAGSTWYESLGGRERTDFGAVDLMSLREAADLGFGVDANNSHGGVDSAIMGLDPTLVQSFVARSKASK